MTQAEAKKLVCDILSCDCHHHMMGGVGEDDPRVKTKADVERLHKAFTEMEDELERRSS